MKTYENQVIILVILNINAMQKHHRICGLKYYKRESNLKHLRLRSSAIRQLA